VRDVGSVHPVVVWVCAISPLGLGEIAREPRQVDVERVQKAVASQQQREEEGEGVATGLRAMRGRWPSVLISGSYGAA